MLRRVASIIDHFSLTVRNYAASKAFYKKALAPLGIGLVMERGASGGFGKNGKPEFWIGTGPAGFQTDEQLLLITPVHVAFVASRREEVDAFYKAALAAGGKDFGAPGLRPSYHAGYYGAFVIDPDGHNIEAVLHSAS